MVDDPYDLIKIASALCQMDGLDPDEIIPLEKQLDLPEGSPPVEFARAGWRQRETEAKRFFEAVKLAKFSLKPISSLDS